VNKVVYFAPMAVAGAWLLAEGAYTSLSDFYPPVARLGGWSQMAAGIALLVALALAWLRPRRWVFALAVILSTLLSLPPIWTNVQFANEYGWDVGLRNVAISLCFAILLTIACAGIYRVTRGRVEQ
jgi:hypothetical protein